MRDAICRATAVVAAIVCVIGAPAVHGAKIATPEAPENWIARRIFDPFHNETRCVVETPKQKITDGRQDTTIYLRVDGKSLLVLTESNVDLNHPDVGIRVDDGALIKPDKAYLDQNVLFESSAASIISQFKAGLKVDVALRYWPTWPSTGLKTATFSLIGFTRAFARLPGC
jgi:hypothetical protein